MILISDLWTPKEMGLQDSSWNISVSGLVILVALILISCWKKDRRR